MIFILHYILLNVGLPAVILLITLFLHTHSDASLSEIGALLMALPFVSILTKPLFCALADRHRAHKQYLMVSLALMALGYGSLVVAPTFFPEFVREHGRLVWYLDVVGVVLGFGAFGIVWSLGDALAVNGAQMAGVSWGSYRLWAVVSWGLFGVLIGQINELPCLPAYVPGLLLVVVSLFAEIVLLALWPNERFVMCAHLSGLAAVEQIKSAEKQVCGGELASATTVADERGLWPSSRSRRGTITASTGGTLNAEAKVLGVALANALRVTDVGDTLKSTLGLSAATAKSPRKGLDEILGGDLVASSKLTRAKSHGSQHSMQTVADRAPGNGDLAPPIEIDPTIAPHQPQVGALKQALQNLEESTLPQASQDIQLLLIKLIVRRDKTLGKYLVLFTLFGCLTMCHISYFFMHVKILCDSRGDDFALIMGLMMLAQATSEVNSFIFVARYTAWAGRRGALMTCAGLYLVRFLYYGFGLEQLPTCLGVPFEFCHGLSYGILYSLICDIAVESVDQVDEFLPELIQRGLIRPDIRLSELKSPLRATMQGVFSGAFDGLGNGLGALFGGVFLDAHPFPRLWQVCAGVCLVIMVIYPLTELQICKKRKPAEEEHSPQPPTKRIDTSMALVK